MLIRTVISCSEGKTVGANNLVDFVKDFNFEYLAQVKAHDKDRQA